MTDEDEFFRLLTLHFRPVRELSPEEIGPLYRHYVLLTRWNRALNLTRIRQLEDVVVRHYCESLYAATLLPDEALRVLDVGSGAGFPGVPMAVLRPDCEFVLAESHQRKAVFLKEATRTVSNVRVAAVRAEELSGAFDWVVSRAVAWKDVLPVARRLGRRLALLVGEPDASAIARAAGFTWEASRLMPWGKHSVVILGSVLRPAES